MLLQTIARGDYIFEVRVLSFRNPIRVIPRVQESHPRHTQSSGIPPASYPEFRNPTRVIPRVQESHPRHTQSSGIPPASYPEFRNPTRVIPRVQESHPRHTQSSGIPPASYPEFRNPTRVIPRVQESHPRHTQSSGIPPASYPEFRNPTHVIPRVPSVCCDGPQVPPNCMDPCDLVFFFCNREFGVDDFSLTNCPFGNIIIDQATSRDEDGDNVDFTVSQPFPTGAPNPLTFEGTAWPVSTIIPPCP